MELSMEPVRRYAIQAVTDLGDLQLEELRQAITGRKGTPLDSNRYDAKNTAAKK